MAGKALKSSIICILRILEKYSDKNHLLGPNEIVNLLDSEFGIQMERKAVANDVKLLSELFDDEDSLIKIVTKPYQGAYVEKHVFSDEEIRFFIDALLSNYSVNIHRRKVLYEKLFSMASVTYRKKWEKWDAPCMELYDPDDDLSIVEDVNEAIRKKRKLSFVYAVQGCGEVQLLWTPLYAGIRKRQEEGKTTGRYYVLFLDSERVLQWVRMDYIDDLSVSDEPAETISTGELIEKIHEMKWEDPQISYDEIGTYVFLINTKNVPKDAWYRELGTDIKILCQKEKAGFAAIEVRCSCGVAGSFFHEYWRSVVLVEDNGMLQNPEDKKIREAMEKWYLRAKRPTQN